MRSYEVDLHGRLTLPNLCNYLQESAGLHARALGVSVEQLLAEGMTWFLWRLHLQVDRLPTWPEQVSVETWPAELGKPYAVRDFRLGIGDELIGVATSAWLLMDLVKKRPVRRLPPHIVALHPDPPHRALPDRFHRLPQAEPKHAPRRCTVRRSDLDLNGHLNHVAAISTMLESTPAEVFDQRRIESLEVEYRGEGHFGDELASHCSQADEDGGDGVFLHRLTRPADGKELVRGRSRWAPLL